jgi:hypothetical protein
MLADALATCLETVIPAQAGTQVRLQAVNQRCTATVSKQSRRT